MKDDVGDFEDRSQTGEILAKATPDKGPLSKIHKELLELNREETAQLKMGASVQVLCSSQS